MKINEILTEEWSQKYKNSINCSHPRGFSQRAHCAGKKKHNESVEDAVMEMVCEDCGLCETHGSVMEIKKGQKDSNGYTRCWPGKHAEGTKQGKNGGQVRNCVPNESLEESNEGRCMQCGMKNCKCPGDSCKCKPIAGWEPGKGFKKAIEEGLAKELEEEFDLIESIVNNLAEHNGVDAEVIWEDLETLTEDELYAFAVTSEPIMESQDVAETMATFSAKASTSNSGSGEFRGVSIPSDMKHPEWREPTWSFQEIAQKLGIPVSTLNLIAFNKIGGFPEAIPGLSARHGSKKYYKQSEVKRWVNANNVREKLKQDVAEDWQKANKRDRTAGMSQKAVNAYRREHPGSKLKTAVTTKPSKLKRGSKASKRRKSYCSRSRGQMKMHSISCAKTPDKAICKARRRWNC
jgi:hypothetical protein